MKNAISDQSEYGIKASSPRPGRHPREIASIILVCVQSFALLIIALGSAAKGYDYLHKLAQPKAGHRRELEALILAVLGVACATAAAAMATRRRWGRGMAVTSQIILALIGLLTLSRRPTIAIVTIGIAGVVLFILGIKGSAWDSPSHGAPMQSRHRWDFQVPPSGRPDTSAQTQIADKTDKVSVILAIVTTAIFLGALVIRSSALFGIVLVAVIFIPLERLLELHPQKILRKGWYTDIVHFLVNNIFTSLGVVLVVIALINTLGLLIQTSLHQAVHSQPFWIQFIEAVLLMDLASYLSHRASHQVPFLWRFHAVHHSISEMDWLAAARLHPIDSTFRQVCIFVPLYVMGFTRATFGSVLAVFLFMAIFQHANIKIRYGPLRWIVMNPQAHHWHHANEPDHYNKNFAGAFPVIDVMFGTAYIPATQWPSRYGIDNPTPAGYLRQMAWPFRWNKQYSDATIQSHEPA